MTTPQMAAAHVTPEHRAEALAAAARVLAPPAGNHIENGAAKVLDYAEQYAYWLATGRRIDQ